MMEDNRFTGEMMYSENKVPKGEADRAKRSHFYLGLIIGVFVTLMLTIFICAGLFVYKYIQKNSSGEKVGINGSDQAGTIVDSDMETKLQAIEQIIDSYYYLEEVEDEVLEDGVYRGVMSALGDPYSTYYSAEELQDLLQQTQGIYYGIGAYVSMDTATGLPKISSPIPGAPAEEAGLRKDDIIYEVDGQSVYGMDLNSVVALIKGEEGTTVCLTIARSGESDYLYVDVMRRKVESPTVDYEMLENGMAYITILEFDTVTVNQFADALENARADGMKGMILDLRANPGGSLDAVVKIARMLLPEGMIVYTEDKYGNGDEYTCDGTMEFDLPLVVLIDGNSASASEILAGAIQDYELGTLVGTTTYGKGIVQQIITLADGSAVKLTISSYFTPKGRDIHGIGIEPDLECTFDGEAYYNEDYDNQLEYAKEVLLQKIQEN